MFSFFLGSEHSACLRQRRELRFGCTSKLMVHARRNLDPRSRNPGSGSVLCDVIRIIIVAMSVSSPTSFYRVFETAV